MNCRLSLVHDMIWNAKLLYKYSFSGYPCYCKASIVSKYSLRKYISMLIASIAKISCFQRKNRHILKVIKYGLF